MLVFAGSADTCSAINTDFEGLRNKHQDLSLQYGEKVRACARAQKMYDELRKQMLQLDVQNAATDAVHSALSNPQNQMHPHQPNRYTNGQYQTFFKSSAAREPSNRHGQDTPSSGSSHNGRNPLYGGSFGRQGKSTCSDRIPGLSKHLY